MLPTRHPRSRVSQVRKRVSRGSCSSIRISIVRNTVPATSIKAAFGLGLILFATDPARADEEPCPPPPTVTATPPAAPAPATNPATEQAPITIEADDQNFEFDVDGNAKLCGN